jgi:hypothetical protein
LWILERPDRGIKANRFKRGQLTGQSIVSQLFFFNNFHGGVGGGIQMVVLVIGSWGRTNDLAE